MPVEVYTYRYISKHMREYYEPSTRKCPWCGKSLLCVSVEEKCNNGMWLVKGYYYLCPHCGYYEHV